MFFVVLNWNFRIVVLLVEILGIKVFKLGLLESLFIVFCLFKLFGFIVCFVKFVFRIIFLLIFIFDLILFWKNFEVLVVLI